MLVFSTRGNDVPPRAFVLGCPFNSRLSLPFQPRLSSCWGALSQSTTMEAKKPDMKSQALEQARSWAWDLADEMDLPGILKLTMPRRPGPVENSLVSAVVTAMANFQGQK